MQSTASQFRLPAHESVDLPEAPGTRLAFESFGLKIGVSAQDRAWLEAVPERLPPGWRPIAFEGLDRRYHLALRDETTDATLPTGVLLITDGHPSSWAPTPDGALEALESAVQMYVAEFASPHLFVHAGVVRFQGTTVMLPGSSFAGKSTLVSALVDAGATYYSDEYAVLDAQGKVHAYPRRMSLRDGPRGPARRVHLPAASRFEASPVDIVLLSRYEPGRAWTCEALDHGAAILALCEHTVAIQRRPADALSILAKVAEEAVVFRAIRGDLESALAWLQAKSTGVRRR